MDAKLCIVINFLNKLGGLYLATCTINFILYNHGCLINKLAVWCRCASFPRLPTFLVNLLPSPRLWKNANYSIGELVYKIWGCLLRVIISKYAFSPYTKIFIKSGQHFQPFSTESESWSGSESVIFTFIYSNASLLCFSFLKNGKGVMVSICDSILKFSRNK